MIIVWGTRLTRKRLGRVAEICPVCRCPAACDIARLSKVQHLYFIPIGGGTPVAQELTCTHCKILWGLKPDTFPAVDRGTNSRTIEELLESASPERVELITRRMTTIGPLSKSIDPNARADALVEGLFAIDYHLKQTSNRESVPSAVLLLVNIALVIATAAAWFGYLDPSSRLSVLWPIGFSVALLISLALAAWHSLVWLKRQRILQHRRLAISIAPFQPAPHEIEGVISIAKSRKIAFAKRLDPRDLSRMVEECRVA